MKAATATFIASIFFSELLRTGAAEWKAYFGNLHAHTSVSDGVEMPADAYAWARDQGQLNFLCLSEHNHMLSANGLSDDVAASAPAETGTFVTIVGQEFSTLPPKGGNHVNVHNVLEAIPADLSNNYRELYSKWLPAYQLRHSNDVIVCQFNHPDKVVHDYGAARIGGFVNYDSDWNSFVSDADHWVRLIAVLSGPADSNIKKTEQPPQRIHRDMDDSMVRIWQTYLERGFHLSPVADQDNHRKSWGTRTLARTGVWLNEPLTKKSLLEALKSGRCFATEDSNLSVWFAINHFPMGSRVPDPGTGSVSAEIRVVDEDEPNSKYNVQIFRDKVGDGKLPAPLPSAFSLRSGETKMISLQHVAGEYELFFLHVAQISTGAVDDAWTAPIWLDPAIAPEAVEHDLIDDNAKRYMAARYSDVYHFAECKIAKKLTGKRIESDEPIPGKRLHKNCPTD